MSTKIPLCQIGLLCLVFMIITGCGPAAPRFRSDSDRNKQDKEDGRTLVRSDDEKKTTESETEKPRENDSARDFRKENNPSLTPLDQSRMMREISKYMGTPYVVGGEDLNGIDCSGYVKLVFEKSIGKQIPRKSSDQARMGVSVGYDELMFGDLVFFNTNGEAFSHVGIYLGDDLFAHASFSLGVTISSLISPYYKNRYEGARRIIK